ncbi:hypothetical protein IC232_03250 [Microvirga sp. BT688]|uniref:hypothetical protein n=1 Tax=Microvirga sp. TaxID=1873136 RepID=UPI0016864142|nr:hypothetical protein [Microvirga sp.]MBD2745705.1 hypothetical protein [Microvirga sp.]
MNTPAQHPARGSASSEGPKLLGFQLADRSGVNIQGDEDDPLNLTSFQIMTPAYAIGALEKLGDAARYLLMPIFEGDVEEPHLIGPTGTESSQ